MDELQQLLELLILILQAPLPLQKLFEKVSRSIDVSWGDHCQIEGVLRRIGVSFYDVQLESRPFLFTIFASLFIEYFI